MPSRMPSMNYGPARRRSSPDSQKTLGAIRRLLASATANGGYSPDQALTVAERSVKSIFIHQFMDPETFDLSRARKCCQVYPQLDGRLDPGLRSQLPQTQFFMKTDEQEIGCVARRRGPGGRTAAALALLAPARARGCVDNIAERTIFRISRHESVRAVVGGRRGIRYQAHLHTADNALDLSGCGDNGPPTSWRCAGG